MVTHNAFVARLENDVFILTTHNVLMRREIGCKKPLRANVIFGISLSINCINTTARTSHVRHNAIAKVTLVIIRHPCVDITSFCTHLPTLAKVVIGENTTEGMLALAILKVGIFAIIGGKHGKFAVGIDIPRIETQTVATIIIVICLLQEMKVFV